MKWSLLARSAPPPVAHRLTPERQHVVALARAPPSLADPQGVRRCHEILQHEGVRGSGHISEPTHLSSSFSVPDSEPHDALQFDAAAC